HPLQPIFDFPHVERVSGDEDLLNVEPVLRAVKLRLTNDEVLRGNDWDGSATEGNATQVFAHPLMQGVSREKEMKRGGFPIQPHLVGSFSLALVYSGVDP